VEFLLLKGQMVAKSSHRLWKSLNCLHLNNQGSDNQNSNVYVDLNSSGQAESSQTTNVGWNWVHHNQKSCVHFNQEHVKIKEQAHTTTKNEKVSTAD